MLITKLSKTEFETSDGAIHPILFDLDEDISVAQFQAQYDDWLNVFSERGLLENETKENDRHRRSRQLPRRRN
jgi:hypothetical protein